MIDDIPNSLISKGAVFNDILNSLISTRVVFNPGQFFYTEPLNRAACVLFDS